MLPLESEEDTHTQEFVFSLLTFENIITEVQHVKILESLGTTITGMYFHVSRDVNLTDLQFSRKCTTR